MHNKSLVRRPCDPLTLCGISSRFQLLSPTHRQVIHALLTRPPLTKKPKSLCPFDLNVLSTPPAFILSQDQTLDKFVSQRPFGRSDHSPSYDLALCYFFRVYKLRNCPRLKTFVSCFVQFIVVQFSRTIALSSRFVNFFVSPSR